MHIFLIIIGVIALFFFGKFIYDSYLTKNNKRSWQEYKEKYPEDAARIDRNKGLNLSTKPKPNINDKMKSLSLIAEQLGCQANEVKENFLNDLELDNISVKELENMLIVFRSKKLDESKQLDMDIDDTPSALMETWTLEYFNKLI
jgi:hypothetical protein